MPEVALPPDLPDDLAAPLGRIIVKWSSLEHWVSMLLGTVLGADLAATHVISTNVAISSQSKWIRAIMSCKIHEHDNSLRVSDLLTRADDLRSERNELIHGILGRRWLRQRHSIGSHRQP